MASSGGGAFGQNNPQAAPRRSNAKLRHPPAEDVLDERTAPAPHASASERQDPSRVALLVRDEVENRCHHVVALGVCELGIDG